MSDPEDRIDALEASVVRWRTTALAAVFVCVFLLLLDGLALVEQRRQAQREVQHADELRRFEAELGEARRREVAARAALHRSRGEHDAEQLRRSWSELAESKQREAAVKAAIQKSLERPAHPKKP